MNIAKILLVDDEVNFLSIMEKRLSARDMGVVTADSGKAALDVLEKDPEIDVVVLDVKMPGMDGLDVLRAIRSGHPLVEVIMLTGHGTIETAIDGMKNGAFDYLLKPCEIETLMDLVRQAKDKKDIHEEKIIQAQMKDITGRMGV
ncbi:response regulator [Pseudodesulfovibrio senegalensis]|jgi:DNA-binding NtrC family response regulator|uniref:Response regulator n=1 Tax=Pseudodesulfovibrio senegalensis TaxID=1721087 RepID=A0A6N6N5R5_9BACT|nr:response regulator [Pseudodesulfovibrio senegalensis]KAB1442829.1 response regulator [Pseudodesulfovibrio senegalensis]